MVLLSVTAETWIVTGLGFGIVLLLLFCLVFILQLLGWCMQKITAPKAPAAPNEQVQQAAVRTEAPKPVQPVYEAGDSEMAAIAMALYLYEGKGEKHDLTLGMIHLHAHETAWNAKEIEMNNKGF